MCEYERVSKIEADFIVSNATARFSFPLTFWPSLPMVRWNKYSTAIGYDDLTGFSL